MEKKRKIFFNDGGIDYIPTYQQVKLVINKNIFILLFFFLIRSLDMPHDIIIIINAL